MLGLKGKLLEHCPYGAPPAIDIEANGDWTINEIPRAEADPDLCQIIIASANACSGCPLNIAPEPISDSLGYLLELDEIVSAGARLKLSWGEWKAIALLKRKRQEAEMKRMKEKP